MRLANALVVLIVVYVASVRATLAPSDKSRLLGQATSTNVSDRPLSSYDKNNGDNTNTEERAINLSDAKQWIKTMFKNWYQKWRDIRREKATKELTNDVSPETVDKMLQNEPFKREMFKKWNKYRMEDIKLKLGQERLNNEGVAKMLVNYVQDYRVYRNIRGWREVK
ncbi:secreted RxLR effector peptide protein, putative [Phytophthora infestans T30-4]|uniref:RxLR effector protein n=2 Tax=Phytophthora infestans TaxID=4787 RepID=A0A833T7U3_PHYIN